MARPSKPNLTTEESAAILGVGDRKAAGIVSAMRGANLGSITREEASRRRVSHEWVRLQRQTTKPPNNPKPSKETDDSQTIGAVRADREAECHPPANTVRESTTITERTTDTGQEILALKVESERGAA